MSKKNKFIIFCLFNILILICILVLSSPLYKTVSQYTEKKQLRDNEFVKNSIVINPNAKSEKIINRTLKIKFNADVDSSLNWDFKSQQDIIEIKIGENSIVKYEGKNLSNKVMTVTADFIALPKEIIPYLIKTECFCFTSQTLGPGESQIFTVVFFFDPSLDSDNNLDDIKDLTFTYKLSEYTS